MSLLEDSISRHRLLGVVVWFSILMLFVPGWYANPAKFVPNDAAPVDAHNGKQVLFANPYLLPNAVENPVKESSSKTDSAVPAVAHLQIPEKEQSIEELVVTKKSAPTEAQIVDRSENAKPVKSPSSATASQGSVDNARARESLQPGKGSWIVLLSSYEDFSKAEKFKEDLADLGHFAEIKYFAKTKQYQVRAIGLDSLEKAQILKQKLDKIFNLKDSKIRNLK